MRNIDEIEPGSENIRFIAKVIHVLFRFYQQLLLQTVEETTSDASSETKQVLSMLSFPKAIALLLEKRSPCLEQMQKS